MYFSYFNAFTKVRELYHLLSTKKLQVERAVTKLEKFEHCLDWSDRWVTTILLTFIVISSMLLSRTILYPILHYTILYPLLHYTILYPFLHYTILYHLFTLI